MYLHSDSRNSQIKINMISNFCKRIKIRRYLTFSCKSDNNNLIVINTTHIPCDAEKL